MKFSSFDILTIPLLSVTERVLVECSIWELKQLSVYSKYRKEGTMVTERPPGAFSEREPEHGLPTPVFSACSLPVSLSCATTAVSGDAVFGEVFLLVSPRRAIPKAVPYCKKPKIWWDVHCPCSEMSVQRNILHLYLSSHLLCISGYKSMNRNAHRRVVEVVWEPAASKSDVTMLRLRLLKPFSSALLPCRVKTRVWQEQRHFEWEDFLSEKYWEAFLLTRIHFCWQGIHWQSRAQHKRWSVYDWCA